jgi:hypothetical protein
MQSTNQYQVISIDFMVSRKRALEELTQEVNKAILSGWEPLGGVVIHDAIVAQALVKRR